jgi:hypothetical protein
MESLSERNPEMDSNTRRHAFLAAALALIATALLLPASGASSPTGGATVARAADHTWAVVHTRGVEAATEIYVTYRDGHSERLTKNRTFDGFPAWSPDPRHRVRPQPSR